MDAPLLLKPYHGVQWLENRGSFPFEHHSITPMCGVYRALAADFGGKGKKDIVAVSCLPEEQFPQRVKLKLDSVLFLEHDASGSFSRHSLDTVTCNYFTATVGDVFGSGRNDIVTGSFFGFEAGKTAGIPKGPLVTIWKNLGPRKD